MSARKIVVTVPVEITVRVAEYAAAVGIIPPGLSFDAIDDADIANDIASRFMAREKQDVVPPYVESAVARVEFGTITHREW